jgi:hypothetical protein
MASFRTTLAGDEPSPYLEGYLDAIQGAIEIYKITQQRLDSHLAAQFAEEVAI